MSLYQGRKETGPLSTGRGAPWLAVVASLTLLGACGAGLIALLLGAGGLALGFFLGGILSLANFLGLKLLVERAFPGVSGADPKAFWLWNAARWCLFALLCWGLLAISRECLLGALLSYLFFLGVLGWVGVKLKPGT